MSSEIEHYFTKRKLLRWRIFAFLLLIFILLFITYQNPAQVKSKLPHIARISVSGLITSDSYREERLDKLINNEATKAVILRINSGGGTIVGGESLLEKLDSLAKKKPLVVVMEDNATSAAYMIALAGERIYAYNGTITGSIGVLMETGDITALANKLGVNLVNIKSTPLKGSPLITEKITPEIISYLQAIVEENSNYFNDLVAKRRHLTDEQKTEISSGKAYTGKRAVALGLVDEIGNEEKAVTWLREKFMLPADLEIIDFPLEKKKRPMQEVLDNFIDSKVNIMVDRLVYKLSDISLK